MAAPKENLLSLGHLTGTDRNTFTKQREHSLKKSRAMHLLQHWQELKERELAAQQHNRQLLQQFEEAQGTLKDMLTLTTTMKTIRVEYERYLEESSPRWKQQLKEKTQAAQKKRMEEYLKSYLKNTEEQVTKSSGDRPLLSQGPTTKPQKTAAPQKHYSQNNHLDYNQDGSPHLPYTQSSWQPHPQSQMARFPIRAPYQPQGSTHVPPSFLPPPIFPHPFQLHHLASTPGHHHPWPGQNQPGRASPQPDYPWLWTAGAAGIPPGSESLWGRVYMEEPPPERAMAQVVAGEAEMSRVPSSKRERGGGSGSSHLSQELDIKPVRLSSGPAESSESSRESSQVSREKRKRREKKGRSRHTSSDRERHSSQESFRTSSVIVSAAVTVTQSSESDASTEKGRTSTSRRRRRSGGFAVGSPRPEKVVKERTRSKGDDNEESESTAEESRSEEAKDRSPDDQSESCREEESGSQREEQSGSASIKIENGGGDLKEKEESSSSEESSAGEKDEEEEEHEKDLGDEEDDGDEKEESQRDEEQEQRAVADDDEERGAEEEMEEQESEGEGDQEEALKNEEGENGKQGSASSQDDEADEDESEGGEEDGESDEEEEGGGGEEEEQIKDEAEEPEEEGDSEDSVILPQDNKPKKMHIIPEEASEDEDDEEEEEEGSKTGSSDDDSNELSNEDIEHLLAPQEQSQKEKDTRAEEKPKALCDKVEIFQVETDRSTKSDHPSDSEEFDHFYD